MPTATWWNLDAQKRDAIVQAALHEFAAHNYAQASLSAIVKSLGIAKGSVYQYFTDKEEFYLYTVKWASDRVMHHLERTIPVAVLAHGDAFAIFRHYLHACLQLRHTLPAESQLIQRALIDTGPQRMLAQEIGAATHTRFIEELVLNGIANRSLKSTIDPRVYQFVLQIVVSHVDIVVQRANTQALSEAEIVVFCDQLVTMLDQGMRYQLRK
jgi:AcrR family transcriptional regulator